MSDGPSRLANGKDRHCSVPNLYDHGTALLLLAQPSTDRTDQQVKTITRGTLRHAATPREITTVYFNLGVSPHGEAGQEDGGDDDGPTKDWPTTLRQIAFNLSQTVPTLIYLWIAVRR